ncbi:MAG: hypothetical protein ACR2FM_05070 [Candidatus Saccharimonadales bacterium]
MTTTNLFEYIEANTLRLEASHRGGGIEIDASGYLKLPGAKMTAYQNYLGGGMTGSVQSSRNFTVAASAKKHAQAEGLAEALKQYYYNITNELVQDWDEWAASDSYLEQQTRAGGAY